MEDYDFFRGSVVVILAAGAVSVLVGLILVTLVRRRSRHANARFLHVHGTRCATSDRVGEGDDPEFGLIRPRDVPD